MIKKTFVKIMKEEYTTYTKVKGNNGVVVCTLECKFNYIPTQITYNTRTKNDFQIFSSLKNIIIVKGVAVCSPNDTFDESLGKKIALSKAKSNMFKKASKYYEYYLKWLTIYNKELEQIIHNLNVARGTEYTHLQFLKKNND